MRRLPLVAAVVLVALGAAGLITLRRALDADTIRGAAEVRLSALLGQQVTIGGVSVSMLPVPSVIGTEVVIGPTRAEPELALQRIRIVPRVRSLFSGPYVIRDVTLEGLTVRIVHEPDGRWKFPAVVPAPGGSASAGVIIERVRLTGGRVGVFEVTARDGMRQTSSIDDIEGEAVSDAAGLRVSPIRGRVRGSAVTGEALLNAREARMDFTLAEVANSDLAAVLGLAATEAPEFLQLPKPAAVSMSIRIDRTRSTLSGTGSLRAPEVAFYSLKLAGLEAPVKTNGVELIFAPATFTLYGGAHRGAMAVDLSKVPARWALDSSVTGLDVGDFLSAMTGRDQRIDGTGAATAALSGGVGDPMPHSLAGRTHVNVVNGVIREFPLLSAINRALRLAEGDGRDTKFERLSATFAFAGRGAGYATTQDLVLQAREVRVEAAGRIGFDRSLDLAGQAILSPERTASAIRSIRELSGLRNDRGELELPLTIGGTLDDPSFGIDLKAVIARSLKEELRRRVRNLFRRDPG